MMLTFIFVFVFMTYPVDSILGYNSTARLTLLQDNEALESPTADHRGSLVRILNQVSKFVGSVTGINIQIIATYEMDIDYIGSNMTRLAELIDSELRKQNLRYDFPIFFTGKVFSSDVVVRNAGRVCQENTTIVISTANLRNEPTKEIARRMAKGLILRYGKIEQIQERTPKCLTKGPDTYRSKFPICGNGILEFGEFLTDSCAGVEDISLDSEIETLQPDEILPHKRLMILGLTLSEIELLALTISFVTLVFVIFTFAKTVRKQPERKTHNHTIEQENHDQQFQVRVYQDTCE